MQVLGQHDSKQTLGVVRRSSSLYIVGLYPLSNEIEVEGPIDDARMLRRHVIFDSKVVGERLKTAVLTDHASTPPNQTENESTMLGNAASFKSEMQNALGQGAEFFNSYEKKLTPAGQSQPVKTGASNA